MSKFMFIKYVTFTFSQALRDIWANERALNLSEQILGTADIAGHPNWNLRSKTPNNEASTVTKVTHSTLFNVLCLVL